MNEEIQKENKEQVENRPSSTKNKINNAIYKTGMVAAKTVVGVGVGAVAGIGAVVALSVAEVTLPALLVLKAFGFTGGAVGFLSGLTKKGQ